jgi:hypothetical protein
MSKGDSHQQQTLVPVSNNSTLRNHIHVSVRMKPLSIAEKAQDKNRFWTTINDTVIMHN